MNRLSSTFTSCILPGLLAVAVLLFLVDGVLATENEPALSIGPTASQKSALACVDLDGDGYGSPGDASCTGGPETDCDDDDAANFPGNTELCDGQDNDCNGLADFAGDEVTDDDSDGAVFCLDCDDSDPDNFPGNTELCDGQDNDCNGLDDAGNPGVGGQETDNDGDGQSECAGDCNDSDIFNFLGNTEICDGQDNNCNGLDDVLGFNFSETDNDLDGFSECQGDVCDDDPACSPAFGTKIAFASAATIASGFDGSRWVATGDIDRDGDLDVLGAAFWDDEVAWWENTAGDGSTWSKTSVGVADGVVSVALADLDGDGDLDVLSDAFSGNEILWWENTAGDGSVWSATNTVGTSFSGPQRVQAADIDGDGDLDILGAASVGAELAWWENTAGDASTWTKHSVAISFQGARAISGADMDGDGDLDLVGAAGVDDEVSWWENTAGDGTAWTERLIAGSFDAAVSILPADMDGDGDLDVVGAARNDDAVTWWENTAGDGTAWTAHSIASTFNDATNVSAADADGDGDLDIIAVSFTDDQVTWWENTAGDGSTWAEWSIDSGLDAAYRAILADLDGDGDLDALGAGFNSDNIVWWRNETLHRSATPMAEHMIDGDFNGTRSVFAADVDGDGDTDVLGAAGFDHDITWWENTAGDGTTWTKHTIDALFIGANSVFAADVDGDGDTDVLGARSAGDITWWENTAGDGTTWTEHTIDASFSGASSVYAADVDGDGDLDVLGAAYLADDITWWENTAGDGTSWTKHTIGGSFDGAEFVYAADVDGDGDLDVLGAAYLDHDITWWENTAGDGTTWTEHTIDGSFQAAESVYPADLDGDGDTDVLGAARFDNDITWWENTVGDGTTWVKHTIDSSFSGASHVYAADMDGDGDTDVLGAAGGADDITWWENMAGDGTTWTEHTIDASFEAADSVYAADVDGDGDLDVLGAALVADDITWWKNQGDQFALPTLSSAPATINSGAYDDVLTITAIHRGKAADRDLEVSSFELLFEESEDHALSNSEANALLDKIEIWRDDPDGASPGAFDDADTMILNVDPSVDGAGVQGLTMIVNDETARVSHGNDATFFVVTRLQPDAAYVIPNSFVITHLTEKPSRATDWDENIPLHLEYASNTATSAVQATAEGDLAVSVDDGLTNARPGQPVSYTITVSNAGPADAAGATINNSFAAELGTVNWTCSASAGSACPAGAGSGNLSHSIDVAASGSVTFVATGTLSASPPGILTNTATVTATAPFVDLDALNDAATDTNTLLYEVDLAISKDDGLTFVSPGDPLTYTLTISNAGPDDVVGARVTDTFPTELLSVTWTCSGTGAATCTVGGSGDIDELVDIPAGESVTLLATATLDVGFTGQLVLNIAQVSAPADSLELLSADNLDGDGTYNKVIFADGFESGSTVSWTSQSP